MNFERDRSGYSFPLFDIAKRFKDADENSDIARLIKYANELELTMESATRSHAKDATEILELKAEIYDLTKRIQRR